LPLIQVIRIERSITLVTQLLHRIRVLETLTWETRALLSDFSVPLASLVKCCTLASSVLLLKRDNDPLRV